MATSRPDQIRSGLRQRLDIAAKDLRIELTPRARQYAQEKIRAAAQQSMDGHSEAELYKNWGKIIHRAAEINATRQRFARGPKQMTSHDLQSSLKSLCPIWPFC